MNKKPLLIIMILLLGSGSTIAGQIEQLSPRKASRAGTVLEKTKRVDVLKVVPHLAASDDWKSMLIFRNDLGRTIRLSLDFYAEDGLTADAVCYDSDEVRYETDRLDLFLAAYEIYSLEFDKISVTGLLNLSVYIFTSEADSDYSVEVSFNNFNGQNKVASVAGGIQLAGANFFMNVDERLDAYTNNRKIRGLAVTNVTTVTCDCSVVLWDELGNQVDGATLRIGPQEKWLGTVSGLLGSYNLNKGIGLLDVSCRDRFNPSVGVLVSAVGLAFESNTPIVGSVPIEHYIFDSKGKQQRRTTR